ncbi:MAG: ABC transporter ATP-binding protein [Betaproteobacteria bacterium]|nr:ABC transporter ATP-binding protein [Betaproteobacteria bacterium]
MPIIRCLGLSKCYRTYVRPADRLLDGFRSFRTSFLGSKTRLVGREFWALRKVSFEVARGESVGIIGRNGSGKSTLLQLIAGILSPTEGTVHTRGSISALLELGAGFNPEFTGVENARLNAALLGLSAEEIEARLPSILEFAEIGEHVTQPVKTYSSGMYVRLAFSVMAHTSPGLLIVDEALAVGDAAFQAKCIAWIRSYLASGGSLLLVSHDVATVRALCNRAIYLEHGQVKAIGPAGDVTDQYLRDVHQSLNAALQAVQPAGCLGRDSAVSTVEENEAEFAAKCETFAAQWIKQSFGTGEARIRLVELFDEGGRSSDHFEFDAPMRLRIHVECLKACSASINYKIRDRNLVAVAGADFLIVEHGLLDMEPNRFYRVEYKTRLPLRAGDYSLRLSISYPIEKHAQAVFLDIVEVALPFKVLPSPLGHIYTQTYLPNSVSVHAIEATPG